MPRVPGIPGPYRFFYFSFDCREPKHVHARRERMACKFWPERISPAGNHGFPRWELNVIWSYIEDHLAGILESWDEHCG